MGPMSVMPEPSSRRFLRLLGAPEEDRLDFFDDGGAGALGTPGIIVGALPIISACVGRQFKKVSKSNPCKV